MADQNSKIQKVSIQLVHVRFENHTNGLLVAVKYTVLGMKRNRSCNVVRRDTQSIAR